MKKLIPVLGVCVFLVTGFAFGAVGDSVCHIQSKPGTCIETKDKDTIYVPNDMVLFGKEVSFCPTQYARADSIQLIIVLDQSGSMRDDPTETPPWIGNDNNRDAIRAAQRLVDSVALKSPASMLGVVLFPCNACSIASVQGFATGYYPLKMTPTNANTMKMNIQAAYPYNGYGTPYGAGLDTALNYFNRLPAMPRTKRFIIFLSDGEPNGPSYTDFLNAGKAAQLPPTHTIYYHTSGTNTTAQNTLIDLANRTGGTPYNASSVSAMYAAFSDILKNIVTKTTIENFVMLNNATGQIVNTNLSDSSAAVMVPFEPLFLQLGANPIQFIYKQKGDTSKSISGNDVFKTVTVFRRPGTTSLAEQAEFDGTFLDLCFEKSSITFTNSAYVSMPTGAMYDITSPRAYLAGRRGPGTSGIQVDTVIVKSRSGDEERVVITETGALADAYRGSVLMTPLATRTKFNNTIEVLAVDTLYLTYSNKAYYTSGAYYDRSVDTIPVTLIGPVKSVQLYQEPGNPASLTALPPPTTGITVNVDVPLNLWAKGFDGNGYWKGDQTTNLDTMKVHWTTSGFRGTVLLTGTADSAYNLFAPHLGPDTGFIIASKDTGGGMIRDSIRVFTIHGAPIRVSIEEQPSGLSASTIDTLVIQSGKLIDTVYAVGRDKYNNPTGNLTANWSKAPSNVIFNATPGPDTKSIISRVGPTTSGVGYLTAQATTVSLPLATIQVRLDNHYYTALQINQTGSGQYTGGTINTGDTLSLEAWGVRSTDGGWERVPVGWALAGLTDQVGVPGGTIPNYVYKPLTPGTGTITATLVQYGSQPTLTAVVNMVVTPEPPTRYEIALAPTQLVAGSNMAVTITAYNSDGVYPANLDMPMWLYTDQTPTAIHLNKNTIQTITGTAGGDTLGGTTAPAAMTVRFVNGVATLTANMTIVTPATGSRLHIYDSPTRAHLTDSPLFVVTAGALSSLEIVDKDGNVLVPPTLDNKNDSIFVRVRGYDPYGNPVGGTTGNWSVTSPLANYPFTNPESQQTYIPYGVQDPGRGCGQLRVNNGLLWDSVAVCVVDSMLAVMTKATTRDTDGDGYLDRIDVKLSEPVVITTVVGMSSTISVTGRKTWGVERVELAGVNSDSFHVFLTEKSDTMLETGLKPTITFPAFAGIGGLSSSTIECSDGAGPVIKSALMDDRGNTEPNDDVVTVTWSETINGWNATVDVTQDANEVFAVWYPDSGFPKPDLLAGSGISLFHSNQAGIDIDSVTLTTNHWLSIDSLRGGIRDFDNNYTLKSNRKVKLAIKGPPNFDFFIYPNPIKWEDLKNGTMVPHLRLTILDKSDVTIYIYDLAGNLVRKFAYGVLDNNESAGSGVRTRTYEFTWDGKNGKGRYVNRGGYVAKGYARPLNGSKLQVDFFKIGVQ